MEVFSMMLSVDVLRMSHDSRFGAEPFFSAPADLPRTQVIVLDDLPEGPVYDLWSFFAGSRLIRLRGVLDNEGTEYETLNTLSSAHAVIVPLPGRANHLSRLGQDTLDCHGSALARTFAGRVLQFYGALRPNGGHSIAEVARVTIINSSSGTRKINTLISCSMRSTAPSLRPLPRRSTLPRFQW